LEQENKRLRLRKRQEIKSKPNERFATMPDLVEEQENHQIPIIVEEKFEKEDIEVPRRSTKVRKPTQRALEMDIDSD